MKYSLKICYRFCLPSLVKTLSLLVLVFLFTQCDDSSKKRPSIKKEVEPEIQVDVPSFNEDSAYAFIEQQVAFGPRVPGTDPWRECADYLVKQLESAAFEVTVQEAEVKIYDGTPVPMKNIIGRWKPELTSRILLFAHWDTRPFADKDNSRKNEPIDGANDGGSGVGVILEIAKTLGIAEKLPNIGLDVIFFDVEDWGEPEGSYTASSSSTYCLGSQYWANNPPIPNFRPRYGILLDMVGAADGLFVYEEYSMTYAKHVAQKVWKRAAKLGHQKLF
ncbi:MAG: M28 family peptidase, partial [Salibacteraceae bacterium]